MILERSGRMLQNTSTITASHSLLGAIMVNKPVPNANAVVTLRRKSKPSHVVMGVFDTQWNIKKLK
jgi:hypothetical protein